MLKPNVWFKINLYVDKLCKIIVKYGEWERDTHFSLQALMLGAKELLWKCEKTAGNMAAITKIAGKKSPH